MTDSEMTFSYGRRASVHVIGWLIFIISLAALWLVLMIKYSNPVVALFPVALVLVFGLPHAIGVSSRLGREPSRLTIGEASIHVVWADRERKFPLGDVKVSVAGGSSFMDALVLRRALEFRVAGVSFIIFGFINGYDRLCRTLEDRGLLGQV